MVETRSMVVHHNPDAQVNGHETTIFNESYYKEPWVVTLEQRIQGLT